VSHTRVRKCPKYHCCWQHRRRISPVNTRVTRIRGGELCVAKLSDGVSESESIPMGKQVSGGHRESEQNERTRDCVLSWAVHVSN
jgi:hypothetical protein